MTIPRWMSEAEVPSLSTWATAALVRGGYCTPQVDRTNIRVRPWSVVIPMDTDRGRVWAKANARDWRAEAALLEMLTRVAPAHVLPLIDSDRESGRFLCPDGGPTLRGQAGAVTEHWSSLLSGFAELQQAAASVPDELRSIGLPDQSPETLPDWWERALDRAESEPHVRRVLPTEDRDHLRTLRPTVRRLSAEIGADPLSVSVDHADLHPGNVFVSPTGLHLFDWGDATLSHPFFCLGTALRTAQRTAGTATVTDHLREVYLRRWMQDPEAPVPDWMRRSAVLAEALSWVGLAGSWTRLPAPLNAEFAGYYAGFLTGFAAAVTTCPR